MNLTLSGTTFDSEATFDHEPADSELTCLLEAPYTMIGFHILDTPRLLRVCPDKMPIIVIMASMIVGAVIGTVVPIIFKEQLTDGRDSFFFDVFLWFWIAFLWFLLIPFWTITLTIINRNIGEADDILRVDKMRRVLELCRSDRMV